MGSFRSAISSLFCVFFFAACGETVSFTSDTTVSDPMTLDGTVIVDVSSGATVTISGSISGDGGIVKTGSGTLIVTGNNSFTGSFIVSNGVAKAYGRNSLGDNADGMVAIRTSNSNTKLHLGNVTVRKQLVLHSISDSAISSKYFFVIEPNTTNTVLGPLSVPGSYLRMEAGDDSRTDFLGGGSFGSNSTFLRRKTGSDIRIASKPMSIVSRYNFNYTSGGWLTLAAQGCSIRDVSAASQKCVANRRTVIDNALSETSVINGGTGRLDLCGTRQKISRLFGRNPSSGGTVESATPALLELTASTLYTNTCAFVGLASLTLSGSGSVVLTGQSTSSGTLTVESGKTVTFAPGAFWRGGIVVKGTLATTDAASVTNAAFVDVVSGGNLVLPAGATSFRQYRVDGIPAASAGTVRTYIGSNGLWTTPGNWSPSGVPQSGDTALFSASTTITEPFDLPGGVTKIAESSSGVSVAFTGGIGGAEAALVHNGPGELVLSCTNNFTGAFTNLAGTAKVPYLADPGVPSPVGAGTGPAAEIFNGGILRTLEACSTSRPLRSGASAQWHPDEDLDVFAPFSNVIWCRRDGDLAVHSFCSSLSAFGRTDNGTLHMLCPTNTFTTNPEIFAGGLRVVSIADAGLPCAFGAGNGLRFGQTDYTTPTLFSYSGTIDASCNRSFSIYSGKNSAFSRRDGLTVRTENPGTKVRYTGGFILKNSSAANPFLLFDGDGDTEVTTSIPHRFHIVKEGSGTLVLSGNNAATGTCTISSGRLQVNGSLASGMTLGVLSGATLGGNGTVACATTLADGAYLSATVGGDATGCIAFTGRLSLPPSVIVRVSLAGRLGTGEHRLVKWSAVPATDFILSGVRGKPVKRADGLYLAYSSIEDMIGVTQSSEPPYVIEAGPGGAVSPLAAVRDLIRSLRLSGELTNGRPVVVNLAPGDYVLDSTLHFFAQDSGTRSAPVVWRGPSEGTARIVGSAPFDKSRFRTLAPDDPIAARIPFEAQGKVLVADVSDLIPDTLAPWPVSSSARTPPLPLLFLDGRFQEVARWPNRTSEDAYGWTTFTTCTAVGDSDGNGFRILTLDDRAARWNFTEGVWLYGYWGNTWHEEIICARGWNAGTRELTLGTISSSYRPSLGTQSSTRKYVALNIPEELDAPGEWWLDRTSRRLFYIPAPGFETGEMVLLANGIPLVAFAPAVHDIRFENMTFAYGSRVFQMPDGNVSRISFEDCTFHSFTDNSSLNGTGCSVRRSSFAHFAKGCLAISGGNRVSLSAAGNMAEDCTFTDFERLQQTYVAAITLNGCGNAVRGCTFSKSAHEAIEYTGNEHLIGWCDISEVLRETADCGAIYTGRNSTTLGTGIIRCNFHDLTGNDTTCIYFDDCDWGDDAICCTFDNIYRAFLVGGGNLHRLEWNVLRNGKLGFSIDRRGMLWDLFQSTENWWMSKFNDANINPGAHPWSAAYPSLAFTLAHTPGEPWNNVLRGNIIQDFETWTTLKNTISASTYQASTNGMTILKNITASTKGKSGTGITGFTHLYRAATADDVPGMAAAFERADALAVPSVGEVSSPDGSIRVRVGLDPAARLSCRAERMGNAVLDMSPMGVTVDGIDFGRFMRPCGATVRTVSGEKAVPEAEGTGYRELVVSLEDVVHGGTNAQAEVRCFSNGFAWRMRVPGEGVRTVAGEMARWNPVDGSLACSAIPAAGWSCSGEVLTSWHTAILSQPVVTNGILYIDVPQNTSRLLSLEEKQLLTENEVSGAVKTGEGTIHLDADLGGYDGFWNVSNGLVAVSAYRNAFGSPGDAVVTVANKESTWLVDFLTSSAVDRPFHVVGDDTKAIKVDTSAAVRFLRAFTSSGGTIRIEVAEDGSIAFPGGLTKKSNLVCTSGKGEFLFEETPSYISYLYAQGYNKIRFNCPSNRVNTLTCAYSYDGLISLGCDDALAGYETIQISDTLNYTIDLAGHGMGTGNITKMSSGVFTSSAPGGRLRVKETGYVTNVNCRVTGDLTFSKTGSGEFAFAREVESTGALEVDQGILRMTRESSWPNVSRVTVSGTGRLIVEKDGAFGDEACAYVSGRGKVTVADGVTLTFREVRVGGRRLAPDTYRAGGAESFISGGGAVVVRPRRGTAFFLR